MYYLKQNRQSKTVVFDLGDFLAAPQFRALDTVAHSESVMQMTLMRRVHYDAIAVGMSEIAQLPEFHELYRRLPSLTSSNLEGFGPKYLSIGGHRFAVLGWADQPSNLAPYDNILAISQQAHHVDHDPGILVREINQIGDRVTGVIVVGYVHPLTIERLVKETSKPLSILTSYDGTDRRGKRFGRRDKSLIVFLGSLKDRIANLQLKLGKDNVFDVTSFYVQILDNTVSDDQETRRLLDDFFNSRAFREAVLQTEGNMSSEPASNDATTVQYIGSTKCQFCHIREYRQWQSTPHALAMRTLLRVRREHNPGCVKCHVTGFGAATGYSLRHASASLENVGCEACHGPGATHSLHPTDKSIFKTPSLDFCRACHSPERSDFDTDPRGYLRRVAHSK